MKSYRLHWNMLNWQRQLTFYSDVSVMAIKNDTIPIPWGWIPPTRTKAELWCKDRSLPSRGGCWKVIRSVFLLWSITQHEAVLDDAFKSRLDGTNVLYSLINIKQSQSLKLLNCFISSFYLHQRLRNKRFSWTLTIRQNFHKTLRFSNNASFRCIFVGRPRSKWVIEFFTEMVFKIS